MQSSPLNWTSVPTMKIWQLTLLVPLYISLDMLHVLNFSLEVLLVIRFSWTYSRGYIASFTS